MPNYLKLSFVFIGTVIGAGFASGQEIYSFFIKYGKASFLGVCFAGVLFFVVFFCVLHQVFTYNISSCDEYFKAVKMKKSGKALSFIALLFMISSFFVMVSGGATLFFEFLSLPKLIGAFLISGISFAVFIFGKDGILKVNSVLTPFIIFFIIFLGVFSLSFEKNGFCPYYNSSGIITSSIIYVSYNTLTLLAVASAVKNYIQNRKTVFLVSFFSALFLFLMLVILWWLMISFDYNGSELPVFKIAISFNRKAGIIYFFVLYAAMLTTAVSNGGAALNQLWVKYGFSKLFCSFLLCSVAVLMCRIPFSVLVSKLYYVFGIAGLFTMLIVIKNTVQNVIIIKIKEKRRFF